MDKNILEYVGKSLYQTHILKEMKRYVVFRARCAMHSNSIEGLLKFFDANSNRQAWLQGAPALLEQTTRAFFYKGSTWDERVELVQNHLLIMEELFKPELMDKLYSKGEMVQLWEDSYDDRPLTLQLWFHAGQRKEGCMSLALSMRASLYTKSCSGWQRIKQTARMLFILVPCRDRRTVMS